MNPHAEKIRDAIIEEFAALPQTLTYDNDIGVLREIIDARLGPLIEAADGMERTIRDGKKYVSTHYQQHYVTARDAAMKEATP